MTAPYRVIYDDACAVCRRAVSFLATLDRAVRPVPLSTLAGVEPGVLAARGITADDLARALHVVSPGGEVARGWDAVMLLARRHPLTWAVGLVGSLPGIAALGRRLYGFVAERRHCIAWRACNGRKD